MSLPRGIILTMTVVLAAGALLAACGGNSAMAPRISAQSFMGYRPRTQLFHPGALQTPALLTISSNSRALEYWRIAPKGGSHPIEIARSVASGANMAADGNVVAIANTTPSRVVLFDVSTNKKRSLADPFGQAYDVAIGADHTIYALNFQGKSNTISVYANGSPPAREISCSLLGVAGSLAVDGEGNLFDNGILSNGKEGVVEIPHAQRPGPAGACFALSLNQETGSSGIAIEPKTDALVTLAAPGGCAGGYNAEMTIYRRPYSSKTAQVREMDGNCSRGLRFNADSTIVFYGDTDVSVSYEFIREATYPDGKNFGHYWNGGPTGITTIPNTLPN